MEQAHLHSIWEHQILAGKQKKLPKKSEKSTYIFSMSDFKNRVKVVIQQVINFRIVEFEISLVFDNANKV